MALIVTVSGQTTDEGVVTTLSECPCGAQIVRFTETFGEPSTAECEVGHFHQDVEIRRVVDGRET